MSGSGPDGEWGKSNSTIVLTGSGGDGQKSHSSALGPIASNTGGTGTLPDREYKDNRGVGGGAGCAKGAESLRPWT